MIYYAHYNKEKEQYQTNEEHLINVGNLTKHFAQQFNAEYFGYVCGLLHDVGKNSIEFQKRLLGEGPRVDHSSAGAREAKKFFNKAMGILLGYIICGHHAGLMNYGSLESGLEWRFNKPLPNYHFNPNIFQVKTEDLYKNMIKEIKDKCNSGFSLSFFIRMVYSCLVDADYLDTESFMKNSDISHTIFSFDKLLLKFNKYMDNLVEKADKIEINYLRQKIADECRAAANQKINLFTLT